MRISNLYWQHFHQPNHQQYKRYHLLYRSPIPQLHVLELVSVVLPNLLVPLPQHWRQLLHLAQDQYNIPTKKILKGDGIRAWVIDYAIVCPA